MENKMVVLNKSISKEILNNLLKAILSGIMIGVGGTIYLSLDNKVIGAFLFAIGLFIICTRELNLYTGKVGYIFDKRPSYLVEVVTTLIGNFIGTFLVGFLLKFTRIYTKLNEKALTLCNIKLDDNLVSILILSVFCGVLMYLAVDGHKRMENPLAKYLSIFLGVMVFILCGFEHSIANMYYFAAAALWTKKTFLYLLIMVIGNLIGGVIFPLTYKIINKGNK